MKKVFSFMLLLSVLVSACQSTGPSTRLNVKLNDFTITPDQLAVPAGSDIQIRITNSGAIVHDFYIMKLGKDVGEKFEEEDILNAYWEAEVQPDETVSLSFVAPDEPGTYQIVCGVPGHLQAGMVGTMEVVK